MTVTVAASTLAVGDVLDGRPITYVGAYGGRGARGTVVVGPHGWSYHWLDSVVLDARREVTP